MFASVCLRRIDFGFCAVSESKTSLLLSLLFGVLALRLSGDVVCMDVIRRSKDLRNCSAYSAGGMVDSGGVSKHDLSPRAVLLAHVQLCVYIYIYLCDVCMYIFYVCIFEPPGLCF
jgi:hypothetical protein